jgi:hypothetical protein
MERMFERDLAARGAEGATVSDRIATQLERTID